MGGGVLPYLAYRGKCCWTGYGFWPLLACVASVSVCFSRPFEALFAFWPRENWGERKKWKEWEGEGRGEKKTLARNPMILKNAPLKLQS